MDTDNESEVDVIRHKSPKENKKAELDGQRWVLEHGEKVFGSLAETAYEPLAKIMRHSRTLEILFGRLENTSGEAAKRKLLMDGLEAIIGDLNEAFAKIKELDK